MRTVQLVLTGDVLWTRYRDLLHRPAVVTGTLFHAHTGHHDMQVLVHVQAIDALGEGAGGR
ncbi:MAG: DUF4431 domain-containing protein [Acidimicrobiia bacterium]|nr:DUF4431 domain-containing protein [Acidimicrobiia bacterium]